MRPLAALDKVRAEGRLLIFLGEVTELDRVFSDQLRFDSRLSQRNGA